MIKLNVGCGSKKIHGYINIDARPDVNPDVVAEIGNLPFTPNTVDVIYVCHVLEHIHKDNLVDTVKHWHRLLKPGGILRVSVPDFQAVVKVYLLTKNLYELQAFLHGGLKYPLDVHYTTWDRQRLEELLVDLIGFNYTRSYDWRKTDHSHVDDYSQAYLPHMDKVNGTMMSLNVEAIKSEC